MLRVVKTPHWRIENLSADKYIPSRALSQKLHPYPVVIVVCCMNNYLCFVFSGMKPIFSRTVAIPPLQYFDYHHCCLYEANIKYQHSFIYVPMSG